ncbi:hypothetical protein SUGI_0026040 [Cryptomeria japonica]|nr:hypothetical protein SUGI_0026040 [Cryptomeria japonica]
MGKLKCMLSLLLIFYVMSEVSPIEAMPNVYGSVSAGIIVTVPPTGGARSISSTGTDHFDAVADQSEVKP